MIFKPLVTVIKLTMVCVLSIGGLAESRVLDGTSSEGNEHQESNCQDQDLGTEMAPLHTHSLHSMHHSSGRQQTISTTAHRSAISCTSSSGGGGNHSVGSALYSALPAGSSHGPASAAGVPSAAPHNNHSNNNHLRAEYKTRGASGSGTDDSAVLNTHSTAGRGGPS